MGEKVKPIKRPTLARAPEDRAHVDRLIELLESVLAGDRAVEELLALGPQVVPDVARFLLESPPRSLALPRCRAVRVLGELGACAALLMYFHQYWKPADASVLLAEDAVRSAAAQALLHCASAEVFPTLLEAVRDRATGGLVEAVGEFRRPEALPILFELLEDDLCCEQAKTALRKVRQAAQSFAVLLLRGQAELSIAGPGTSRRRRATLQLLAEWGAATSNWSDLRGYLWDEDADCVIAAAQIGFPIASESQQAEIVSALIEGAAKINGAQEIEVIELLDEHGAIARQVAERVAAYRRLRGEATNWQSPFWRVLHHLLDETLDGR